MFSVPVYGSDPRLSEVYEREEGSVRLENARSLPSSIHHSVISGPRVMSRVMGRAKMYVNKPLHCPVASVVSAYAEATRSQPKVDDE